LNLLAAHPCRPSVSATIRHEGRARRRSDSHGARGSDSRASSSEGVASPRSAVRAARRDGVARRCVWQWFERGSLSPPACADTPARYTTWSLAPRRARTPPPPDRRTSRRASRPDILCRPRTGPSAANHVAVRRAYSRTVWVAAALSGERGSRRVIRAVPGAALPRRRFHGAEGQWLFAREMEMSSVPTIATSVGALDGLRPGPGFRRSSHPPCSATPQPTLANGGTMRDLSRSSGFVAAGRGREARSTELPAPTRGGVRLPTTTPLLSCHCDRASESRRSVANATNAFAGPGTP
jgi:hypothetical protein